MVYLNKEFDKEEAIDWSYTTEHTSPVRDLYNRIVELEKKMAILNVNLERVEKFPALKEAYESYLIIEKLVYGDVNDKKII